MIRVDICEMSKALKMKEEEEEREMKSTKGWGKIKRCKTRFIDVRLLCLQVHQKFLFLHGWQKTEEVYSVIMLIIISVL